MVFFFLAWKSLQDLRQENRQLLLAQPRKIVGDMQFRRLFH